MVTRKQPFDIEEAMRRLREATAPYPKAALFELAAEGHTSVFEILIACILSIRTRDERPPPPPFASGTLNKAPTFPLYLKEGTGSFNLASMHKVENAKELDALLNTASEELPDKAKPPTTGFYAQWIIASPNERKRIAARAF